MRINSKITRDGTTYDVVVHFVAEKDSYNETEVYFDGAEFDDCEPDDGNAELTFDENATLMRWLHTEGRKYAIETADTNIIKWG